MNYSAPSPAEQAAQTALRAIYDCIDGRKSFLLEAGAGAGKTYSLVKALRYLISKSGAELARRHQRVACITYTNVARDEIEARTDRHPAILSSTIHAFCWSMIKGFQPFLRSEILNLTNWPERLEEAGGVGHRVIDYSLGYPSVESDRVLLHHNDVLSLTVRLMEQDKFRIVFTSRYPILFIDEYQDTDARFAAAIARHFLDKREGPLIGLFGDHWQKIYGSGCGKMDHPALTVIGKEANFRSVQAVVDVLNKMRPSLPQRVEDPHAVGSVAVYHTNDWTGTRRTGAHWAGDLPSEVAHAYLESLRIQLSADGWEFTPDKTKILMLTHNVLAAEQGYSNLAQSFPWNEAFIKKEDPYIAFLVDTVEPMCAAYQNHRYGEMFSVLGGHGPAVCSHADKKSWAKEMGTILELRSAGTIGDVLDHLRKTKRPRLPDAVESKEQQLEQLLDGGDIEERIARLRKLRSVSYGEVIALARFLDGHAPFDTKHGVKGAEFENVIVVCGRGWSQYNFNQFLEWAEDPDAVPVDRRDTFERNRNLFYVTCSRPRRRLAILFTQKLSGRAIATLAKWFGDQTIHPMPANV